MMAGEPALRSFVEVSPDSHFSLRNLPFGVFRPLLGGPPRVGVAIGDAVLDLAVLSEVGLLDGRHLTGVEVFRRASLNAFMALGRPAWKEARELITRLLAADEPRLRDDHGLRDAALRPRTGVEMLLPAEVGDYTDFYSSREHATNVGIMFRGPDNALQPNWLHLPVGYHGRASSLVPGGVDVRRPCGQTRPDDAAPPRFGPSRQMDYELELGVLIGPGNTLGAAIPVDRAEEHVFGLVLVNDWSARDIQKWEYVPLGPFLGKSFATSVSPWVVTLEALAPFRCAGPVQDPAPLRYLRAAGEGGLAVRLEVWLQGERMAAPALLSATDARTLYWSMAQQVAHHTVNGCNLRTGDLLASGTISGPTKEERGSLLELSWRGTEPLELPGGERRTFLEDGDRVTMTGWCQGDGYRVGFGELSARLLPAHAASR